MTNQYFSLKKKTQQIKKRVKSKLRRQENRRLFMSMLLFKSIDFSNCCGYIKSKLAKRIVVISENEIVIYKNLRKKDTE